MPNMENNLAPSEEETISEHKGYVDTEGNEKCQKEKKAQIAFLKDRDEKKEKAQAAYQAYVTKITGYMASYDAVCAAGTATSGSRWQTCSNSRS